MSLFAAPDKPTRPGDDTADAVAPWRLDALWSQQQRWWHEWMESGNLWSSWWLSQLPAFGWPPVGQVLPPVLQPALHEQRFESASASNQAAMQAHDAAQAEPPPHTPSRTPRAKSARHH